MNQFDKVHNRVGTGSVKWDTGKRIFSGGDHFIPMWIADTDFSTLPEITEAVSNRLSHPLFGYCTEPRAFFTTFSTWLAQRHQWTVETDWLCAADGVVTGIALALNALTGEGDSIVVQTPCYDNFYKVIEQNKRKLLQNELLFQDGQFSIDFEGLEACFKQGAKTLLFCNPHNPSGRVWRREELVKLAELCVRYEILVISDDIHADIVHDDSVYCPLAAINEALLPKTITCYSIGKAFNAAAIKASHFVIPDPAIRAAFKAYQERMFLLKLNVLSYEAAIAAYTHGATYLDELCTYVGENAKFAADFVSKNLPKIKAHIPEGTFLMLWDCSDMGLSGRELVSFFTKNADVAFSGGSAYGASLNTWVRVNLGCSRETLEKALNQVKAAFETAS